MSLSSRANHLQEKLGFRHQQATEAIKRFGECSGELAKTQGWSLKQSDEFLAQEDTLRAQVLAVQARDPAVTAFGLGIFDQFRRESRGEDVAAKFQHERDEMLTMPSLGQFAFCCEWLRGVERTKNINTRFNSYGHKHRVEGFYGVYISNGMFIAAAIHLEFLVRRDSPHSPNCCINVSARSIKAMDAEADRRRAAVRAG